MDNIIQKFIDNGKLDNFQNKSNDIKIENAEVLKDKYMNKNYIIGYNIKNLSDKPIKNIYTYIDGKVKKITLEPYKNISIPTKWLILLLSRICYGYKTSSGIFTKSDKDNLYKTIDEKFSNYIIDNNLPQQKIGEIDLLNNKINCKKKEYSYLLKAKIRNNVKSENICNSAKLLGWVLNQGV